MFPPYGRRIHLHDARPAEGRAPVPRDPQGDLALLLSRRQDRRPRRQRRGQVLACSASWPASTRISWATRGPLPGTRIGYPAAGAAARSDQGRPRQRRGGASREQQALLDQFNEISARFAEPMDDDEMDPAAREAGQPPGADRRARPLGARPQDRDRDGRAAAPAGRRRRRASSPAASGAASRSAGCCSSEPDMLLLDEPTNHLDAESVVVARALPRASSRAPSSPSPTTATSSTTWPAGSSSSTRAPGIPWEGNYSSWLEQKERRLAPGGEAGLRPAEDAAARARVGAHGARARGRPRARRASPATRSCARRPSGRPRAAPRS